MGFAGLFFCVKLSDLVVAYGTMEKEIYRM